VLTHCVIGGKKLISNGDNNAGGGVCSNDVYNRRIEPVLVLLSDSYSIDEILVGGSKLSSCPAYTIY